VTDDLVKRLRDRSLLVNRDIYEQAADRIEKLEEALRDIACTCSTGCGGQYSECRARAALGEKKDG